MGGIQRCVDFSYESIEYLPVVLQGKQTHFDEMSFDLDTVVEHDL